jgi:hypothetical protein
MAISSFDLLVAVGALAPPGHLQCKRRETARGRGAGRDDRGAGRKANGTHGELLSMARAGAVRFDPCAGASFARADEE